MLLFDTDQKLKQVTSRVYFNSEESLVCYWQSCLYIIIGDICFRSRHAFLTTTKTQHKFLNSACRSNISPTKTHRLTDEILLHYSSDIYKHQINKSKIGLHWTDGQSQRDFQWTPNCLCIYVMFLMLIGDVSDVLKRTVKCIWSVDTNQWCFPAGWRRMIKVIYQMVVIISVKDPKLKCFFFVRLHVKPVFIFGETRGHALGGFIVFNTKCCFNTAVGFECVFWKCFQWSGSVFDLM